MKTVYIGAIKRKVPESSLKWYLKAGWKVLEETKVENKTDTKKDASKSSDLSKIFGK